MDNRISPLEGFQFSATKLTTAAMEQEITPNVLFCNASAPLL
jgi:hypothetical protein